MEKRFAFRWARTPWLQWVLLIALLARSTIPAGFMPGHGGLMLCSGYTPVASESVAKPIAQAMAMSGMTMSGMDMFGHAESTSRPGHSPNHEPSCLCPFAAVAAATSLASEPSTLLVAFTGILTHRIDFPSEPFRPRGTIVPTRLPRGPPSLA